MPISQPVKPLRILCLHGYHGSARTLQQQMATIITGIDDLAEFTCIDAPALAAGDFGWWHASKEDPGVDGTERRYVGWPRTRAAIVACFAAEGPFDGVFGFSQGAALASLLVGLRAADGKPSAEKPLTFGFAIMIGGFASRDPELARLYDDHACYAMPSLHVIGARDAIVPAETSRRLAAKFVDPEIIDHPGGHVIPTEARAKLTAFLQQRAPVG